MKATIGMMFGLLVAASLVACADKQPAKEPLTTTEVTTTTTAYSPSHVQSPTSDSSVTTPDKTATSGVVHPDPLVTSPPVDPSLSTEHGAVSSPTSAKTTATTSPNVSAADQGNSKPEVEVSARIRRTVMASNTLSFGAKNAKIITTGSKVTLKGNVKSAAEKSEIMGIARSTAGVTEVDDQLVVKQ